MAIDSFVHFYAEYKRTMSSLSVTISDSEIFKDYLTVSVQDNQITLSRDDDVELKCQFENTKLSPLSCRGLRQIKDGELQFTLQVEEPKSFEPSTKSKSSNTSEFVEKIELNQDKCYCVNCGQKILADHCRFTRVLPLPSENWSDFSDMWFCHKHEGEQEPDHHQGPLHLVPKTQECFVGETYFLLRSSRLKLGHSKIMNDVVQCKRCGEKLGHIHDNKSTENDENKLQKNGQDNVYNIYRNAVLFCNLMDFLEVSRPSVESEDLFAKLLLEQSHLYTCFRLLLEANTGNKRIRCLIWLVDPDLIIFLGRGSFSSELHLKSQKVMKLLYKCYMEFDKGFVPSDQDMLDMWSKDNTVHSFKCPYAIALQLTNCLINNTKSMPRSLKYLNDFHVGYLKFVPSDQDMLDMWSKDNTVHSFKCPYAIALQLTNCLINNTKSMPRSLKYLNDFHRLIVYIDNDGGKLEPTADEMFPCCNIGIIVKSQCGTSTHYPKELTLFKLDECSRDISGHLQSMKLGTGQNQTKSDTQSEGQLIARRVGLFAYNGILTVCPKHRYDLGIYWRPRTTCQFPGHNSKGKPSKIVTSAMSYGIWCVKTQLVPVGSGICRKCLDVFKEIVPDINVYKSSLDGITDTDSNDCEEEEVPTEDDSLENSYKLRSRIDISHNNEFDVTESFDDYSQPISCSLSVNDTDEFSQTSSQTSSWSADERKGEVALKDINTALSLISNGRLSPLKYQLKKEICSLHPSSRRMLKCKATTAIDALMNCFAPGQSTELKELVSVGLGGDERRENNSDLTSTIIKLYRNSSDCLMKKQILSLLAKDFTKKQLQEMIPGLTVYSIDQARLHASVHGEGCAVPKPEKQTRERLDQGKLAHALDFFFNPLFHQVNSFGTKEIKLNNGELIVIPEVVRTICHANMVNTYQAFCKESGFLPLSRSTLFEILRICPASKRTNLKGLDNIAADGATAFTTLDQVLKQLKPFITDPKVKDALQQIENDLQSFKLYIKTDFKLHNFLANECPDHCITFALSDPLDATLQGRCNHSHDMVCHRCDLFPKSVVNIKRTISEIKDIPKELLADLLNDIEIAESNILSWKQHLIRCANQDRSRQYLLENLERDEVFIIMDFAMKFLPMQFREKQSEWYGQKGLNWHVCVCIFRDDESSLKHRTYAHIFDQVKQDWFTVVSILEHTLNTVKKQLPQIRSAYIRSDNAGCYHCGNTLLSLSGIATRTGIQIKRYDFSEAQDGKSYCDAKIAHLRSKIRQYVSSGNNVKTGLDMKNAIDSLGGVMGCQAAYVDINADVAEEATRTKTIWKGITKISNIELRGNHIATWKAFEVGCGNVFSPENIERMHHSPLSSTNLVIIADFTVPKKADGQITTQKQESQEEICENINALSELNLTQEPQTSSNVFSCIEPGCSRIFQTYLGLESHILIGKHNRILDKCSTYDKIKIKWKESCVDITKSFSLNREGNLTQGTSSTEMGWALKKDRKAKRFTENVKTYLHGIFHMGEQSGRKANPEDVSQNIRVCRDENGQKMFGPEEYLQPSQIASFFSRLCVMSRNTIQQTVDDEDLGPALNMIDTIEAIDTLNS